MVVKTQLTEKQFQEFMESEVVSSFLAYVALNIEELDFNKEQTQQLVDLVAKDVFTSALALESILFLTEEQKTQLSAAAV